MKNLKAAKRKRIPYKQENLNEFNSWLLITNNTGQNAVGDVFKYLKKKELSIKDLISSKKKKKKQNLLKMKVNKDILQYTKTKIYY